MKNRSDLVKRDNFFIHKEGEKYKTLPDAVETSYVLFTSLESPGTSNPREYGIYHPMIYLTIYVCLMLLPSFITGSLLISLT